VSALSRIAGLWLLALAPGCGLDARVLERHDAGTVHDAGSGGTGGEAPITALGAGEYHSCAARGGSVACWGANGVGQAVPASGNPVPAPARVPLDTAVDRVAPGENHSCALDGNQRVWCWGNDERGQLGRGSAAGGPTTGLVNLPARATTLVSGSKHSCAIVQDRSLWCWGDSAESQLGFNAHDTYFAEPAQVGVDRDWAAISAGQGHTCGIRGDGRLFCWGRNTLGHLGLGDPTDNFGAPQLVPGAADWQRVSLAQDGSCGMRRDGSLWCWGDNHSGQLAAIGAQSAVPVRASEHSDWEEIDTGTFHSCGLRAGGRLFCWGRNVEGQLALGTRSPSEPITAVEPGQVFSEVQVGRFHTCARRTDGRLACAGKNDVAQCGLGHTDYAVATLSEVTF
jgi:alpha-tubulin suppressor-like RCC1 family protein